MEDLDIRWKQRFKNFSKALLQLEKFIIKPDLNELEEQGLIQSFEYNYELSWNLIKDYFQFQGEINISGSRDAFRLAFNRQLISNGKIWMKMIESRQLSTHTYDEITAEELVAEILKTYYFLFKELHNTFSNIISGQLNLNLD